MAVIRSFDLADLPAVAAIEAEVFPHPWSQSMLQDEVEASGRTYLVAEHSGEIIGYGGVMLIGADAHVMTIAVGEAHRRRGVASRLMLALIDAALAGGAEHLTLELRVSNGAARSLYEKFGFAPVGIRPGYYPDEDALVMWALDVTGADYLRSLERIREAAA